MAGALESEGPGCELSLAADQLVTTSGAWAGTRCASGAGLACVLKRPEGSPLGRLSLHPWAEDRPQRNPSQTPGSPQVGHVNWVALQAGGIRLVFKTAYTGCICFGISLQCNTAQLLKSINIYLCIYFCILI